MAWKTCGAVRSSQFRTVSDKDVLESTRRLVSVVGNLWSHSTHIFFSPASPRFANSKTSPSGVLRDIRHQGTILEVDQPNRNESAGISTFLQIQA
jgi:hypothetical protein